MARLLLKSADQVLKPADPGQTSRNRRDWTQSGSSCRMDSRTGRQYTSVNHFLSKFLSRMADERVQRRLAAILVADVVGYSRLMEQNEAGTLVALKAQRR